MALAQLDWIGSSGGGSAEPSVYDSVNRKATFSNPYTSTANCWILSNLKSLGFKTCTINPSSWVDGFVSGETSSSYFHDKQTAQTITLTEDIDAVSVISRVNTNHNVTITLS